MADPALKIYEVEYNNKIYEVEAPEGAPEEEIFSAVQDYKPDPLPNAIQDASREVVVPTKELAEVPGAREYLEELFWKETPYSEANKAFSEKFPEVRLADEAPQQWAENLTYARTPEGRNYYKNNSPFAPVNVPTGVSDVEAPDGVLEEAGVSAQRSLANMANTITGAAGVGADLVGADETAAALADEYLEKQAAIGQAFPTAAGKAVDIRSFEDFGMWGASVLGELVPQLTTSLGSGAIGGAVAKKIVERKAADFVEQQVAQGVAREVAEKAVAHQLQKAAIRGGIVGAAVPSEIQEVGSIYGDTYGATGELKPWTSLLAGTAAASLDTIVPARILSKVGGPLTEGIIVDNLVKKIGKEATSTFLLEGGTEALQTIIEQLPAGKAIDWDEVIEAGLRGGFGGSVVGASTGAYEGTRQKRAVAKLPPVRPEATITAPTATGRRTKAYKEEIETTRQQVDTRAKSITADWQNAPEVETHQNFSKLRNVSNNAVGYYDAETNKLTINTENVLKEAKRRNVTPDDIVSALTYHEGLGHHGLSQLFGDTLDTQLSLMLGNSPVFQTRVQKWLAKNPTAYEGDPNRDVRAFEELLAEQSEKGRLPASIFNRLANTVKDFGRKAGLNLQYSTREVETILGMAHTAVIDGKGRDVIGNGFRATPRYMYAGKDAMTADTISLKLAKEMEQRGRPVGPSGESRNVTGWFKGPDGKWRFEISDNTAKPHTFGYQDIQDLIDELPDFGETTPDHIRSWQYSTGLSFLNELHPETTSLRLSQVLDHPELFEAYPELQFINVFRREAEHKEPAIKKNDGSFHPKANAIYINSKLNEKQAMSVLLHEVQHAIQEIENFARGGNSGSALNALPDDHLISTAKNYRNWQKGRLKQTKDELKAFTVALNDPDARQMAELDEKIQEYEAYLKTEPEVDDELERWVREGSRDEMEKASREQFEAESRFLAKLGMTNRVEMSEKDIAQLDEVYEFFQMFKTDEERVSYLDHLKEEVAAGRQIISFLDDALKAKDIPDLRKVLKADNNVSFQAYESLFGEVEARDVQNRQGMSDETRKVVTPYESEPDITPDQYVIDTELDGTAEASVWHGSPHDFDEFDHSKMGTGEGAQVYGWGTYLTETRTIADEYRNRLTAQKAGDFTLTGADGKQHKLDKWAPQRELEEILDLPSNDAARTYPAVYMMNEMARGFTLDEAAERTAQDYSHYQDQEGVKWAIQRVRDANPHQEGREGKIYQVEIPDNAKWIEWDKPISKQSSLMKSLKAAGFKFTDWKGIFELTKEYHSRNSELVSLQDSIVKAEQYLEEGTLSEWGQKELPKLRQEAIKLGPIVRELEERFYTTLNIKGNGHNLYETLTQKLGSPKDVSEFLNKLGFEGTKYLDGFSRRKGEGTYNYVVFNDKTPKIVNKYMMMTSPDKVKLSPEEIEAMPAEDIFEAENAMTILERMTEGYTPVVMSLDDIKEEAEARGFTTSELMKSSATQPGEIAKKLFMYDIAFTKLHDRVAELYEKMQNGTATANDRASHAKALFTMQEVTDKIFGLQGELGRALAAVRHVNFTRRGVKGAMETVAQFKRGSPFEVLNDPDEYFRYAQTIQQQFNEAKEKAKENGGRVVANAVNLPRALMSTADLSAPLRQGLFLIHKPAWWVSFANMFRYWGSEKAYQDLMEDITTRPSYGAMLQGNLALSSIDGKPSRREEDFQTEWAQKIPGFGRLVRMSERAYAGFLNKLRADVFDQLVNKLPEGSTTKDLKDIAMFVNSATGRGNLHKSLQGAAPVLNGMFFSPRLIASRLDMTTRLVRPSTYIKLNKTARNEYIKSILTVGGLAFTILSLAAMGGAEVEEDPRSTDFAKIKVGNTRYDILGGEGQYITLGARMIRNSTKTADGQIRPYGNEFGQSTRKDAAYKFFENKAAPIPSFVLDYLRGTDAIGRPFEMDRAIVSRFVPMFAQDVYENIQEEGAAKGAAMSVPGAFGVGVQNYKSYSLDTERELEAPVTFNMKEALDGEYANAEVEDGVVKLDDKAQLEWKNRLNFYYKEWMKDEVASPDWKIMSAEEKREVIKSVRNDARKEAKADMLEVLELEVE